MIKNINKNIRCLKAPNASPMTFSGTNTYLVGQKEIAVIDPGPLNIAHLKAIFRAVGPTSFITKILITHSHIDHSPLARLLSEKTSAPIFAFGDSFSGRSSTMIQLAENGSIGGGEGVDLEFKPDFCVEDGSIILHESETITAVWTPGHFGNHLSFGIGKTLFSGDHVMGWASSMVSPPDGDLQAFRQSCQKLLGRPEVFYLPGHGNPIFDGPGRVRWLLTHRNERENQIINSLRKKPGSAADLAERIYTDVDQALVPAATRNVIAHLIDLTERQIITPAGQVELSTKYSLIL